MKANFGTYTFYSVRWATQKGDILEVRAQKVAQLGGGQIRIFGVSVAQLKWPSSKKGGGGRHYYTFFKSSNVPKTFFSYELQ